MSARHHLPQEPVRSKGQATLLPDGHPEMPVAVRDISPLGIGVVAASPLSLETRVEIHIHDHGAGGTVRSCQADGDGFYIAIAIEDAETTDAPAA